MKCGICGMDGDHPDHSSQPHCFEPAGSDEVTVEFSAKDGIWLTLPHMEGTTELTIAQAEKLRADLQTAVSEAITSGYVGP